MSYLARRQSERTSAEIPVEINLGNSTMQYMMCDVSREGAGFQGQGIHLLRVGQSVEFEVPEIGALVGTIQCTGMSGFGISFNQTTQNNPKLYKIL